MKKSMKREAVLNTCQNRATRLNQLEHRRLQININLMQDNLKVHLGRLQREAQDIRYHYTNVVRVVQTNPEYQLWKQRHAYDTAKTDSKNWIESRKLKQKSQFNEVSSESVRPLLVLLDNEIKKPVESINNFLRPTTSPVKKHLTDQERQNPLPTIFTEHSINSNNPIQSQKSVSSTNSFLPSIKSSSSRKLEPVKLIPSTTTTQATSNLDTLYQTAYKSIEKPRKLLDKQFSTQHRAVKATIRPTGLVN